MEKNLTLEKLAGNCCPWDGLILEKFMENFPTMEQGKDFDPSPSAAAGTFHALTKTPIPCLIVLLGEEGGPGKEGEVVGRCF